MGLLVSLGNPLAQKKTLKDLPGSLSNVVYYNLFVISNTMFQGGGEIIVQDDIEGRVVGPRLVPNQ